MGNTVKTVFFLGLLSGLLLVIGELLGGQSGLVIAFGLAVVMNFGSDWFSDKIVLKKIDAYSRRVPMNANPATAHMFIIKPLSGCGTMSLFSTHPPTEKQVQRLLGTT